MHLSKCVPRILPKFIHRKFRGLLSNHLIVSQQYLHVLLSLNLELIHFLREPFKHWKNISLQIVQVFIEGKFLGVFNMILEFLIHSPFIDVISDYIELEFFFSEFFL